VFVPCTIEMPQHLGVRFTPIEEDRETLVVPIDALIIDLKNG
jgi:hypothetical protein